MKPRGNLIHTQDTIGGQNSVIIIGGGDAAIMSALFHLSLGFNVTIFERNEKQARDEFGISCLRIGASGTWIRRHSGGEYPSDEQTALDLLSASIIMAKIMPEVIYNEFKGVQYLISAGAEKEGIRTLAKQKQVMDALGEKYDTFPDHCQILGNRLYTQLDPEKIKKQYKGQFVGGVETEERGINPVVATYVLLERLKDYVRKGQLEIFDGNELTSISRIESRKFKANFLDSSGQQKELTFSGRLINCSGVRTFSIACQLEGPDSIKQCGISSVTLYHRGMGIANITDVSPKNIAIFPMGAVGQKGREGDKSCGMYAAINDNIAYVYGPTTEISYLPISFSPEDPKNNIFINLTTESYTFPENLFPPMSPSDKQSRIKELQKRMEDTYPQINNVKIIDLVTAPLVVVNTTTQKNTKDDDGYQKLAERTLKGPFSVKDDAEHIILEKGTHAVIVGMESARRTLVHLVNQNIITKEKALQLFSKISSSGDINRSTIPQDVIDTALYSQKEKEDLPLKIKASYAELLQLAQERFGDKLAGLFLNSLNIDKDEQLKLREEAEQLENLLKQELLYVEAKKYEDILAQQLRQEREETSSPDMKKARSHPNPCTPNYYFTSASTNSHVQTKLV